MQSLQETSYFAERTRGPAVCASLGRGCFSEQGEGKERVHSRLMDLLPPSKKSWDPMRHDHPHLLRTHLEAVWFGSKSTNWPDKPLGHQARDMWSWSCKKWNFLLNFRVRQKNEVKALVLPTLLLTLGKLLTHPSLGSFFCKMELNTPSHLLVFVKTIKVPGTKQSVNVTYL